jgi:four helix bundle protein
VQRFRDLKVWNKAHALTLVIYEVSETFPAGERYGLTSQIRRAAASIPTNIAEGCGRSSSADFGRFLQMAMGSASELEYLLMLARDLRMLAIASHDQMASDVEEVKKMLSTLILRTRTDN